MDRAYEKAIMVRTFQSEFNLIRQDRKFLDLFFPDSEFYSNLNLKGLVNFDAAKGQYNLYFRVQGIDYQHFSGRGMGVAWLAQEQIPSLLKDPKPIRVEPKASPPGGAAPGPSASPSSEPSAPADLPFKDLSPSSNKPILNHPLAFVWPFVLRGHDPKGQYRLISEKEPVWGHNCAIVEVRSEGPTVYRVAVDASLDQIIQVQVLDPATGDSLTATYTGFYPPDPETGFSIYNRLQVDAGPRSIFLAELVNPVINPDPEEVVTTGPTDLGAQPGDRGPRNEEITEGPPVFTAALIFLVTILGATLAVLGYRYVRFAVSRQEFAEELVLIDEENGRFGELLEKLGYSTVPFHPEILTHERNLLGKGATADTTQRPRAVVVAPEAFGEAKGYFFLLRAYVEEGGRVLVMYHSPKTAVQMPFTSVFVPMSPGDSSTAYSRQHGAFPSLNDDEVARLTQVLAARELYAKVNDRPVDSEQLVALNRSTGVKASVVGLVRQGRGEYLLCQMHFDPRNTLSSPAAQNLIHDLLAFLQARRTSAREETLSGVS